MPKIIIVSLESMPSRYTYYWKEHIPNMLKTYVTPDVISINPDLDSDCNADDGAFINFAYTNTYKAKQAQIISDMFIKNEINEGDVFLFTDAWNPVILQVRYMIDLLEVNAKIASIWHAGSYDPQDFLGRKIHDKRWSYNSERAFYYASDINFFATEYHLNMLSDTLDVDKDKACVSGFPMEYIKGVCYSNKDKNIITFPHRLSEEKNYNLFKEISKLLPEYQFVACQENSLTKEEYYDILSKTKILFSANKQETLGIGVFEGMMSGAFPLVPNYLSYKEMYHNEYKYNPELIKDAKKIAKLIKSIMENDVSKEIETDAFYIYNKFFTGKKMYSVLKRMLNG